MSTNESCDSGRRSAAGPASAASTHSIAASVITMSTGIFSNSLAIFILAKSYKRQRVKSRASFLLFAGSLVVTDLLGHLVSGSMAMFVHSSQRKWETFDPHRLVCGAFGASLVFFGLSPLFLGCAMAVERCIGVTRPIFHSTVLAPRHMKRLLALTWPLAALVAALPLPWRRYRVQSSKSFCFFRVEEEAEEEEDWLDVFLPLLFSTLGLLALLLSIVCNAVTSCTLLQARLRRKHHCRGTSYHIEMICQLLAIMLVSCVCWGPLLIHVFILSSRMKKEPPSFTLLLLIRMATWNQILDPWVYILLRRAVLRKIFTLFRCCWDSKPNHPQRWQCTLLRSSVDTSNSGAGAPDCHCHAQSPPANDVIRTIT